jgi:hypothetical protein
MKLRFENIFEAVIDDPARAKEAQNRANLISAVRDVVTACQWNQEEKISVTIDESTIVISRAGLKPRYTLVELLEKCDDKSISRIGK